jgi:hypothetical protein
MDRLADTAFLRAMRGPATHIFLPGIRHSSFTDWSSLDSAYRPEGASREPQEVLSEIASYLEAFYLEYLMEQPQSLFHPRAEVTYYDRQRWLTSR